MALPDDPLTLDKTTRETVAAINAHLSDWRMAIHDVEECDDGQGTIEVEYESDLVTMQAAIQLPTVALGDKAAREAADVLAGHAAEAERAQSTIH